jgi:glutaredoxin
MKHYVLIIKNSCPHCQNAISLLQEKDLDFVYNDMEFSDHALATAKGQFSWDTVPMIWEQEVDWSERGAAVKQHNFIGGYSDLLEHFETVDEMAMDFEDDE